MTLYHPDGIPAPPSDALAASVRSSYRPCALIRAPHATGVVFPLATSGTKDNRKWVRGSPSTVTVPDAGRSLKRLPQPARVSNPKTQRIAATRRALKTFVSAMSLLRVEVSD